MSTIEPRVNPRGKGGMSRSGKPTLRTIAEMTGLAITTISRALNNAPELSQETRERVQKIAAEVGYVPDRAALRLKTGRTNVISLILDPHDEILNFSTLLVKGVSEALSGTSYHLVISPNKAGATPLDPVNYVLRNRTADGIIFSRTEPNDARVRLLLEENFPFATHGRTEANGAHPFVDYDNFEFAYASVMRLHQLGRRRISMIAANERFTFGHHLRAGFAKACEDAGITSAKISDVTLDDAPEKIRIATMRRICEPDAPDGYVCPGDAVALAVMAAITDSGQQIGKDADVVTKQMSGIFSLVRPRIDVVTEDIALAGRQLGELLLRRINGEAPDDLGIVQSPETSF